MISTFNRVFAWRTMIRRTMLRRTMLWRTMSTTTEFAELKSKLLREFRFELFNYDDIESKLGGDSVKDIRRLGGINKFKLAMREDHERMIPRRVLELVETRGKSGECPRYEDLEEWEGKDFVKKVRAHGGLLRVAKELGLRTKMSMRSTDWQDFESFRERVMHIARTTSSEDNELYMPTTTQLKNHGGSRLLYALNRHGGMRSVAKRLGLKLRSKSTTVKFKNFKELRSAIHDLIRNESSLNLPRGTMPSQIQLQSLGRNDIINGIAAFGGVKTVCRLMRMKPHSDLKSKRIVPKEDEESSRKLKALSGRNLYRDFDVLESKLREFVSEHCENCVDERSGEITLPELHTMHKLGRDDLRLSIMWWHGGVRAVRSRLGWKSPSSPSSSE